MFSQTKHQIEFEYFHTFMRALRCKDLVTVAHWGGLLHRGPRLIKIDFPKKLSKILSRGYEYEHRRF